jgi:ribonuclease P protein component
MSPVIARLSGEKNFRSIYKYGRRFKSLNLNLNYLAVPASPTRVAVVVSKQVSNKATKRNLYKRRLWASLRAQRNFLPKTGYLILSAKATVAAVTFTALNQEVMNLLKQIKRN